MVIIQMIALINYTSTGNLVSVMSTKGRDVWSSNFARTGRSSRFVQQNETELRADECTNDVAQRPRFR